MAREGRPKGGDMKRLGLYRLYRRYFARSSAWAAVRPSWCWRACCSRLLRRRRLLRPHRHQPARLQPPPPPFRPLAPPRVRQPPPLRRPRHSTAPQGDPAGGDAGRLVSVPAGGSRAATGASDRPAATRRRHRPHRPRCPRRRRSCALGAAPPPPATAAVLHHRRARGAKATATVSAPSPAALANVRPLARCRRADRQAVGEAEGARPFVSPVVRTGRARRHRARCGRRDRRAGNQVTGPSAPLRGSGAAGCGGALKTPPPRGVGVRGTRRRDGGARVGASGGHARRS